MSWWNPWGELRELRHSVKVYDDLLKSQSKVMEKLRFTKGENEREIKLLEKELKGLKEVMSGLQKQTEELEKALDVAQKNDKRDTKGRFTKAKK